MISRQPVYSRRYLAARAVCLAVWLGASLPVFAQWPAASSINSDQVLVLKNGEVFQGKINRQATQVEIQTPEGSRLVISSDRVDFVCDSMDQAYWEKYGLTKASDTQGQIALFQWCLKHHLIRHAENQIQVLAQSEIKASQLDFLDRQLRVALAQSEPNNPPTPIPTPIDADRSQLTFRPLPPMTDDSSAPKPTKWLQPVVTNPDPPMVRQVEYQQSISDANANAELAQILFNQELDAEMRDLPRGTVGNFRRQIEPLLLKSCQTAGCHNSEAEFPLVASRAEVNPLRLSQRNLHYLMKYIDRQALITSPAWLAATQPHAGQAEPLFAADSRERYQLEFWLVTLADDNPVASDPLPTHVGRSEIVEPPVAPSPIPELDSPQIASPLPRRRGDLTTIGDIPELGNRSPGTPRGLMPLDPFDPEIFNRQQHGDK